MTNKSSLNRWLAALVMVPLGLAFLPAPQAGGRNAPPASPGLVNPKFAPKHLLRAKTFFPSLQGKEQTEVADDLAALKIFTKGSPLRRPKEDWEGARKRVADPAWKNWLKSRRADADAWLKRHDRTDWIAGWYHDFVSPKDGSFLRFTLEEPGEYLASKSDPKVKVTTKIRQAWVGQFRQALIDHVLEAARLFHLTGERKYADWAMTQLDFYAANYQKMPVRTFNGKSRLMAQSLDEATALIRLVNAARILDNAPQAARFQRWNDGLFRPAAALLDESYQSIHNIACWHRSAQCQIALANGDLVLWKKALDGPFGIRQQIAQGVTADHLWREQSLHYNQYVAEALMSLFLYDALLGLERPLEPDMRATEDLLLMPILLRFPTGQLPNPADSTGGLKKAPDVAALARAYRLFPTPIGLAAAAKQRNWDTLLDPPGPVPLERPLPALKSRLLDATRLAILKQGEWQVFFHYGQVTGTHAQQEALNFEAFYGSTDVTHDAGTVGYGSPRHKEYYSTGLAHNVPLVQGRGQVKWAPGNLIGYQPAQGLVAAEQGNYQPGIKAIRTLKITGNRLIDTASLAGVTDEAKPQAMGLALHLQGKVTLPAGFVEDKQFAGGGRPASFKYWKEPRTTKVAKLLTVTLDCGRQKFRVTFGANAPFRITHGLAPDVPPGRNEAFYLELTGKWAEFHTTIEPTEK